MKKMFLLLVCIVFFAFGQANDKIVKDARKSLASKDYGGVAQIYKSFADTAKDNNPVLEFLKPIYIEAVSFQKKYDEITDLSVSFIAQFPNSTQVARVYYLWGVAKANLGDFVQAIVALDEGLNRVGAKEKDTEKAIKNLITRIANDHISQEGKNKVIASGISEETLNILRSHGSTRRGEESANSRKSVSSGKIIGLLVPMTGEFSDLGKTTLNTVQMILAQNEEKTGEKIALKIYDTEGSAVKTAQRVNELLNDNISMVIGPVMSNTATVAAAVLSQYPGKAVMITPTATDDGIAALGKNIFQINLTQKSLAEKIANYAVEDLNIKKFVILAPLDEYGRVMTDYFTAAVKEKGAIVEFTEYFSPSASDYRKQFMAIRQYYTNLKFNGDDNGGANYKKSAEFLADSMITLGGLFLPVSQPQNAIQLAAQVPFHKLRAQILGSNVWGNQKVINDGKTTVQNICFSSAHIIDAENEQVKDFVENYKARYGQNPNMVVAPLVADAVLLMLKASSQSNSVADLSQKLLHIENYIGLSSEISFKNSNGVNGSAAVMKISGQRALRVK